MTEPRLYTPAQFADLLQVGERQLMEWRRVYAWPSVVVGRTIRFTADQVEEIVQRHTVRPQASAEVRGLPGQTRLSAVRHRSA